MPHSGIALIDPQQVFFKIPLLSGMRVADFGCGRTGHFVFPAARVVTNLGIVYGVDIMKDVLESLRSRVRTEGYDNVQTVWSDLEVIGKTPIPEGTLDAAFFVNVMWQIKNRGVALSEAARLLRPGGKLAIVDWLKKLGPLGPAENTMAKSETIVSMARAAGLDLTENFNLSDYHYCLILIKK